MTIKVSAPLSATAIASSLGYTPAPNTRFAIDAQVSDAYVITLSPAPAALLDGMSVFFRAATANTDGATLNVNGLGALAIVKGVSTALATNDILAGMMVHVVYDLPSTRWVIMNPRAL
jgi:hypothetical protein